MIMIHKSSSLECRNLGPSLELVHTSLIVVVVLEEAVNDRTFIFSAKLQFTFRVPLA